MCLLTLLQLLRPYKTHKVKKKKKKTRVRLDLDRNEAQCSRPTTNVIGRLAHSNLCLLKHEIALIT